MMKAQSEQRGKVTTAALLATASLIALRCVMPGAAADDCLEAGAAPPADIATPARLNDVLRAGTSAQLLAMNFLRKPVAEACAWIYEVKVLTASGSVVELDFKADGLDLVGARGPKNDRDAAILVERFGGDAAFLDPGVKKSGTGSGASGGASNSGKGSGQSGGSDDGGGEGGNSGSGGSGGSGSGGSGHDGGDGGGGGEGGEGGGGGDD
jgi:hypothetical protein